MSGHDHTPVIHEHADAWHHHTSEEGLPQHEHSSIVDASALIKWFFGTGILLVVVIIALGMYFTRYKTQMRMEFVETIEASGPASTARADAEHLLGVDARNDYKYTPADKKARTVHLPIDQAMSKTVEKYKTVPNVAPRTSAAPR